MFDGTIKTGLMVSLMVILMVREHVHSLLFDGVYHQNGLMVRGRNFTIKICFDGAFDGTIKKPSKARGDARSSHQKAIKYF